MCFEGSLIMVCKQQRHVTLCGMPSFMWLCPQHPLWQNANDILFDFSRKSQCQYKDVGGCNWKKCQRSSYVTKALQQSNIKPRSYAENKYKTGNDDSDMFYFACRNMMK